MKNLDHVIRKTAADLNLPEKEVHDILIGYWATVNKKVWELSETTIALRHIGVIAISRFKINNFIRKKIESIRRTRNSTKLTVEQKEMYELRLYERLRKALYQRDKLAIHYQKKFRRQNEIRKGIKGLSENGTGGD